MYHNVSWPLNLQVTFHFQTHSLPELFNHLKPERLREVNKSFVYCVEFKTKLSKAISVALLLNVVTSYIYSFLF